MPLKFAAIAPHPPLILESIGKENTHKLEKTSKSFDLLKSKLESTDLDTLIILSPHGKIIDNAYQILTTEDKFHGNLNEFGDFNLDIALNTNQEFNILFQEYCYNKINIVTNKSTELNYGVSIPAHLLLSNLPDIKIVPILTSKLNTHNHFRFGQIIQNFCKTYNNNIGIIASADLSQNLDPNISDNFSPKAKEFDKKVIQFLKKNNVPALLDIDKELIKESATCGINPISVFLGVLDKYNYDISILSYESPFGVGYLLAQACLKV